MEKVINKGTILVSFQQCDCTNVPYPTWAQPLKNALLRLYPEMRKHEVIAFVGSVMMTNDENSTYTRIEPSQKLLKAIHKGTLNGTRKYRVKYTTHQIIPKHHE